MIVARLRLSYVNSAIKSHLGHDEDSANMLFALDMQRTDDRSQDSKTIELYCSTQEYTLGLLQHDNTEGNSSDCMCYIDMYIHCSVWTSASSKVT